MMKRLLCILLLLMMAIPALAEEPPVLVDRINSPDVHADFAFAQDAPLFEVIYPQHLNCDTIFLRCGGETMLVDCATQGQAQRIIAMCEQLGITHIDRVINTHPHEDHIGGFRDLIKKVEVGELWICFPADYNKHISAAVGFAEKADIPVKTYQNGDVLTLGGATIQVWQKGDISNELNDASAQFYITYGERTYLMAADLEAQGQKYYAETLGDALKADILKYPHHGLEKLQQAYFEAVSPLYAVINNNQRDTAGKKFLRTNQIPHTFTVPGFVTLTTDGQTWVCDRIPSTIKY